jgi:hypothetical protein
MTKNNQYRSVSGGGGGVRGDSVSVAAAALAALTFAAILSVSGCGPKPDPTAAATVSPQSAGPVVAAPPAKPGAVIGAGNPPAGQPGHMTPAMIAQMQHYQALAPKK